MVTPSGSWAVGSQAGAALGASENGHYVSFDPKINLFCFWLWEIPIAWVLAKTLGLGPRGVFIAITIAFSTLAVVSGVLFRRGRWKQKKV